MPRSVSLCPDCSGEQSLRRDYQPQADKHQPGACPQHVHLLRHGADAVINDRKNGTFRLSLNGKWKFHYVETFADRPTDFMMDRVDASRWPDINVPGNWELQGFGTPIYVNQPYEFCSSGYPPYWDKPNPPYVPQEWNPTGTYRREFTLPGDWDDKEIFLSADGVRGAAFYYLNGKFVGMSKDAKTPARFNVSAIAKKGRMSLPFRYTAFPMPTIWNARTSGASVVSNGTFTYMPSLNPSHRLQGGSSSGRQLPERYPQGKGAVYQ